MVKQEMNQVIKTMIGIDSSGSFTDWAKIKEQELSTDSEIESYLEKHASHLTTLN